MPALERLGGLQRAVELTDRRFWRPAPSSTFHGRDIFGPVAAHLACGVALDALGRSIGDPVQLRLPPPRGLEGEVLHVDTFGNLVTNIPADALPAMYRVRIGRAAIESAPSYAAVQPRALLALVGSAGLLEISARDASAAVLLDATRGTAVSVEPR
jgi:S-adenosylmethionine hydrolase